MEGQELDCPRQRRTTRFRPTCSLKLEPPRAWGCPEVRPPAAGRRACLASLPERPKRSTVGMDGGGPRARRPAQQQRGDSLAAVDGTTNNGFRRDSSAPGQVPCSARLPVAPAAARPRTPHRASRDVGGALDVGHKVLHHVEAAGLGGVVRRRHLGEGMLEEHNRDATLPRPERRVLTASTKSTKAMTPRSQVNKSSQVQVGQRKALRL